VKKLPYREGSWFVVPLRTGGYALGVVARMAPRGRIILAYLFGTKFGEIPGTDAAKNLQPIHAIRRLRVGDLGLVNGEWRVLGESEGWQRTDWPMPNFVRRDDLSKCAWRVSYSDSDPGKLIAEEPVPFDATGLEVSGLFGYGAVELLLTKMLESNVSSRS
jgi:hypothetical protein